MKYPFTFFIKNFYVLILLSTMESKLVSAQIAPVHAEHILPSFIGPGSSVYHPNYTSAYSYFHVTFKKDSLETLAQTDLYVYSWSGGNFHQSGIAWIRKEAGTETLIDHTAKRLVYGICQSDKHDQS